MFEELLRLEAEGRWLEIRERQAELLAAVAEADAETRARAHLLISRALFFTAGSGSDWRECLRQNRIAFDLAPAGSWTRAFTIQRMSSLLVDMGRIAQVRPFAESFIKLAPAHPEASDRLPYAHRALARVAYAECRWFDAASLERKTQHLFRAAGNDEEAERSNTFIVWCYARAGRPDLARTVDMSRVPDSSRYAVLGAEAAVYAAEGNWSEAARVGRLALEGERLSSDFADAAEVCFIINQANCHLRATKQLLDYISLAAEFAARQDRSVWALLILSLRAGGGDSSYAHPAASLGSGGLHLDACFTTGVG